MLFPVPIHSDRRDDVVLHRVSLDPQQISELLPGESIEVTERVEGVWATGLAFARVDVDPAMPVGAVYSQFFRPSGLKA